MLYSHDQLYKHICICMQNHNDDTMNDERHSSFEKYTSHFIWKGCVWEGVGDRIELQHIDLPSSSGHSSVSFSFSWVAQPEARGPSSLLGAVFSTASFLQHSWSPNCLNFLCIELYNSSTPTQSLPINSQRNIHFRRLWNGMFWSSSSGNNCHAVHRSPSSGASVCDCTVGF